MQTISIKRAAAINAVSKYSIVLVNLVLNAVLARILSPSDFGTVAVISVFTSFFAIFSDAGIGSAIIQKKALTEREIEDIFSCTVYLGIFLCLLFGLFSFFIAAFYGDRVYVSLGWILSISILFSALNIVPNALLMRAQRFVFAGIRNIIASTLNFIIAIALGVLGLKAYAVVWGSVCYSATLFILNYMDCKLPFHWHPKLDGMKKIWSFSTFQLGFTLVNYFSRNLDNLLAGKILGAEALGYYDKSYKLMLYPINNLVNVITPVLHPILSEHQDDKGYIYEKYVKLAKILSSIGTLCSVICFFCAEEIVLILYGSNWLASIPCFRILSITIAFQMVSSSAGAIYQSLGDTKTMFLSGTMNMVATVICIVSGILVGGINSLSTGVAIALVLKFFIEFSFLIRKSFNYELMPFLAELFPDVLIAIAVAVPLWCNKIIAIRITSPLFSLLEKAAVAFSVYIILLLVTKRIEIVCIMMNRRNKK